MARSFSKRPGAGPARGRKHSSQKLGRQGFWQVGQWLNESSPKQQSSRCGGGIPLERALTTHIEELLEQGQKESSGRFTLDPRRARELLRQWQLAEPHHYVLSLVSALVGLGAKSIRVLASTEAVELRAEGVELNQELLRHPLQALFQKESSPAERELAMGINAALGWEGARVRLSGSGWLGDYQASEFHLREDAGQDRSGAVLTVARRGDPKLETQALKSAFRHCPIPLWLGERQVSSPLPELPGAWTLELRPESGAPRLNLEGVPIDLSWIHPGPVHALIQVGGDDQNCHWLVMGRSYVCPLPWRLAAGGVGLRLWAACDQLDRDLSLGALVDNERYGRIAEYLRNLYLKVVDRVLEGWLAGQAVISQEALGRFRPLVVQALEASARAGQRELARELQAALLRGEQDAASPGFRLGRYRMSLLSPGLEADLSTPPRESLPELWESARATLAIRGVSHPMTRQLLWDCAEKAGAQGRWELVVASLEPFLQKNCAAAVRARLGEALLNLERWNQAREQLQLAVEAGQMEERDREWLLRAREQLAQCQARLGQTREATQQLAEVLRLRREYWGHRSARLGPLLVKLTALCHELGEQATATHYGQWLLQLDED